MGFGKLFFLSDLCGDWRGLQESTKGFGCRTDLRLSETESGGTGTRTWVEFSTSRRQTQPRSEVPGGSQLSALSNNEESVSHSRKLTGNPGWAVAQDWPRQTADNAGSQLHFSLRGRAEGLVCFLSSALKSLTSEQLRFLRGSFLNNFLHCLLQFFLSCRLLLPAEEEN